LSVFLSILSSVLGTLIYFVLHYFGWRGAAITAIIVAVLPAVLIVVPFVLEVEASIWRTRFKT